MTKKWAEMPYCSYRVSGTDAVAFLQGQLTQDIGTITPSSCHYGAYCNHQGAMLANVLIASDKHGVVLRLHKSLAEATIERLKKFILRSAVTIELRPVKHIGLNRPATEALCQFLGLDMPAEFSTAACDSLKILALPSGYFELQTADKDILSYIDETFEASVDAIEQLRLFGGHFHILPQTVASILPQETPLEKWGAISYNKGCYVGQEIIARSKYRGKIRKGLAVAQIKEKITIDFNTEIFSDKKSVGKVIEYHQGKNSTVCLASLTRAIDPLSCLVSDKTVDFEWV